MRMHFLLVSAVSLLLAVSASRDQKNKDIGTVIGIDLGTSSVCMGVFVNGRVEIIPDEQGNRITPSYVAYTREGARLIGECAEVELRFNPEHTVFNVKRLIGRNWNDSTVERDIKYFPFKVQQKKNRPHIELLTSRGYKIFTPEEISAMILGKMKETAEAYLGKNVTHAVVTVPTYFTDAQRQATKDAGTISGLNVIRIINKPTAAAVAYGFTEGKGRKNVLFIHLGAGNCDVSLVTILNGIIMVKSVGSNSSLGGEEFNKRVMEHFIDHYLKETGKDISKDIRTVQSLRSDVEKAKRSISVRLQSLVMFENFYDSDTGSDIFETLTRAKFERLNIDLFRSILTTVQKVLDDANMKKNRVDDVVLVGGSTRIPKVQQLVKEFFNGKELSRVLNPDEAAAYGAAVHAGVLSGELKSDILIEVTPNTVGIETDGGLMTTLIPRNTLIPTVKYMTFSTASDNQHTVNIQVYEGENLMTKDNRLLGNFSLSSIPPALRGVPRIEVLFYINADGILEVSANNEGTRNRKNIVITKNLNSPEDMKRMINVAEQLANDEKMRSERVNARNEVRSNAFSLRWQLRDKLRTLMSDAEKQKIQDIIERCLTETGHTDFNVQDWKKQLKDIEALIESKKYRRRLKIVLTAIAVIVLNAMYLILRR